MLSICIHFYHVLFVFNIKNHLFITWSTEETEHVWFLLRIITGLPQNKVQKHTRDQLHNQCRIFSHHCSAYLVRWCTSCLNALVARYTYISRQYNVKWLPGKETALTHGQWRRKYMQQDTQSYPFLQEAMLILLLTYHLLLETVELDGFLV